jgi:hypothetical protein
MPIIKIHDEVTFAQLKDNFHNETWQMNNLIINLEYELKSSWFDAEIYSIRLRLSNDEMKELIEEPQGYLDKFPEIKGR